MLGVQLRTGVASRLCSGQGESLLRCWKGGVGRAGLQALTPARSCPYSIGACGGWEADGRRAQRRGGGGESG